MPADNDSDVNDLRRQRLNELLERLGSQGLTQGEVALRAKVPSQYLSDVKTGRRGMTELFARRLSAEFHFDYLWLLGQSNSMQSPRLGDSGASGSQRIVLPVFPRPIEGDPQAHGLWDGTSCEIVGAAAAKAATARYPYILRFGADDRHGRLRNCDLVLISQLSDDKAEIHVVKLDGKVFLARRATRQGWEPLSAKQKLSAEPTVIGHAVGILWGSL